MPGFNRPCLPGRATVLEVDVVLLAVCDNVDVDVAGQAQQLLDSRSAEKLVHAAVAPLRLTMLTATG